ncbi:hypothetical protein MUK70_10995 [Dyadobacter chenwenxiniae]|uniref:Alpha-L-rhamnosidase six-hairpin glycosidase domain-containing protein n=1 Tax=Dyadobacter chenwenxiniae TaxID=2906456 RepID=A0A9X1PUW5_9BACT|nr:hypothetical protein [Dyadobacter chenwenxiniae]MCF0065601.1 hypothetical protein [Dyadobacter chenwenxiniae]UON85512.1 hypothetical protein MUK70_10995 [Dyadobacter chenwenxiniae]
MYPKSTFLFIVLLILNITAFADGYRDDIVFQEKAKTVTLSVPGKKLALVIDYGAGCTVRQLVVNGQQTLSTSGAFTGMKVGERIFSSTSARDVKLARKSDGITLTHITYGNDTLMVDESWDFTIVGSLINWKITRKYSNAAQVQEVAFPKWNFAGLNVWKGGILDNGGMVWCKYLKRNDDSYGVHTGGVTFWNDKSGNGLRIATPAKVNQNFSTKFSNENNLFTCTQQLSEKPLKQRHNLSRFVSGKADVFAPFNVEAGTVSATISLEYVDYFKEYSRGTLPGINAETVRELMNTTGRYGVVDNNIIGANGWLTNWKCLHEPFFSQIGMALYDSNYTANMAATLNQERDLAMQADGRVLSRWHNAPGDEIPGTYNAETGYYEAMWGYTIDSQPGYVINTSEQFDLSGDLDWLRSHKAACEKALDWLISRDANHNGIFEMMNNNIAEKKASDWLDIVWASYENAFVNAQMFEALNLWANCEEVLGDQDKARHYRATAAKLKEAFNKPVEEGGFWSAAKKRYVYWRDNDGSVHGDNLVTPVNFAAIAFGLCDDQERITQLLDQIEQRTTQENLFHWPLCFDSFTQAEVSPGNWPFPKYENGDIFPTWGYLGVRAYTQYDKSIALKYINKLLDQYKKDGLSSQRYSRTTQLGLGDDILAGICTSITALYRDIYGIRPKWNRMGLEPNLSQQLNSTQFSYRLRDILYQVKLNVGDYSLSTERFTIKSKQNFGASNDGQMFNIYPQNRENFILQVKAVTKSQLKLNLEEALPKGLAWTVASKDNYTFTLKGLSPKSRYDLTINSKKMLLTADANGCLSFNRDCKTPASFIVIMANQN